jgi:polyhydroxybutyrate depolymerase
VRRKSIFPADAHARLALCPVARWVLAAVSLGAVVASCGGTSSSSGRASGTSSQPVASPGCHGLATAPSGESTLSFSSGGKSGTYIQDVPPTSGRAHEEPVVFDLHGYLEPASLEHLGTALASYGDGHGFITITPQLLESGLPRWDYSPKSADISFIGNLLSHVEASLCVDERRVYVTGLSMGAFTTSAIACEMSDRIAAVAPVAGLQAFSWCHPVRPVPVVAFHGTADPLVAYTGGPGPTALTLPAPDGSGTTIGQELKAHPHAGGNPVSRSIPAQVAGWARRNGCGPKPTQASVAADVTLLSYPCAADTSVEFYIVQGGGHTWPGGAPGVYPVSFVGRTTGSIDADQIIWSFFQAHPLKGPVGS